MQNNTLYDLVQRINELLFNGRIDIVYNVAKNPQLNSRLSDTFTKLADFMTKKNSEIQEMAQANKCYRECINKIIAKQVIDQELLSNEYGGISKEITENILRLRQYTQILQQQAHENGAQKQSKIEEFYEKSIIFESQNESLKRQLRELQIQHSLKQSKIIALWQQKQKESVQFNQKIKTLVKQNNELSQLLKEAKLQKQESIQQLEEVYGELQVRKSLVARLTDQIDSIKIDFQRRSNEYQTQINEHQQKTKQRQLQVNKQLNTLKEHIQEKDSQIEKLRSQISSKDETLNRLTQEFNNQKSLSLSTSVRYSNTKNNKNEMQSSKIQINLSSSQKSNDLNASSIFHFANNHDQLSGSLISLLERIKGEKINGVDRLYNFKQHKKHNFHTFIEKRCNILLVCSTQDENLVGAFTTSSFSLGEESQETKAFLFGINDQQISFYILKRGRKSVEYDCDFLIFGNEELCIQRGKCQLTSCLSNFNDAERNYEKSSSSDYLIELIQQQGKLNLKNYQIFEVSFTE